MKHLNIKFKHGELVNVTDSGMVYSTYADAAELMNLTGFKDGKSPSGSYTKEYTVVGMGFHGTQTDKVMVAIEDSEGNQFIIGENGLKSVDDALVKESQELEKQIEQLQQKQKALTARLRTR